MSKEGFCCNCGKTTIGYYKAKDNGLNPTTMCDECTEETGNYCCRCRINLKEYEPENNGCAICKICMHSVETKSSFIDKLSDCLHDNLIKKLKEYMKWDSIEIEVNLKLGNDAFKCFTCDFTHDYIDINADYRN